MKDDVVISIIKNLILACQKENKQKISNDYIMASPRYILNQFIRQINIPANNWHVSKEAKKLWSKLTDEPMKNFYYKNTIHYKFAESQKRR